MEDENMMGESILYAPFIDSSSVKNVYFPASAQFNLFEDNTNHDFEKSNYNWMSLLWKNNKGTLPRTGNYKTKMYSVTKWQQ